MKISILLFLYLLITPVQAEEHENGFVSKSPDEKLLAWNMNKSEWTSIELFWEDFAKSNEAKYWGLSNKYPNYDDVNNFDTILIQLKEGTCLMQFFHSRWRRANDVQRWHDAFNEHSGCPYVFY